MLRTSMGQLLVNQALPKELRDYSRVLDKKGLAELLETVAKTRPEDYRDVSKALADVGRHVATASGGNSFGLQHLRKSQVARDNERQIRAHLHEILSDDKLTNAQRNDAIVRAAGQGMDSQAEAVLQEAIKNKNPLAFAVLSGARGNKMNLNSLIGFDRLYSDHHDNVLPLPVLHSYAEGLKPIEYWAGTYGARKGVLDTKMATQRAGYLSKQLNQVNHRLMVVDSDYDPDDEYQNSIVRGLPVDTNDMDNEGALLARDAGGYPRNTILTPKILKDLERRKISKLLVRSVVAGGTPEGGVYARDAGVREDGRLAGRGAQLGFQSAQGLTEPINQGQLNSKHSGGVAGQAKSVSGFAAINALAQIPRTLDGGATHADTDGTVEWVKPAPAGGFHLSINGQEHYVPHGLPLKVKQGDKVEGGDVLSEGLPNPSMIVKHKGIGEGRRYFAGAFKEAMQSGGMKASRRNTELLARGLINHVRLTDEYESHVPDDVIPYSTLEHSWRPREGHELADPEHSVGKYLETPVLHYTIGTPVRESMLQNFKQFGINQLTVHKDPPPFQPEMIRAMNNLQHDPDWMTRMYGAGLKGGLLDSVHRGGVSDERGTSFVPALARSVDFGRIGLVRQPELGESPEDVMRSIKPKPLDLNTVPRLPEKKPAASSGLFGLFKTGMQVRQLREARAAIAKAAAAPTEMMGQGSTSIPRAGSATPGATGTPGAELPTPKPPSLTAPKPPAPQKAQAPQPQSLTPAQAPQQTQQAPPPQNQQELGQQSQDWAEYRSAPQGFSSQFSGGRNPYIASRQQAPAFDGYAEQQQAPDFGGYNEPPQAEHNPWAVSEPVGQTAPAPSMFQRYRDTVDNLPLMGGLLHDQGIETGLGHGIAKATGTAASKVTVPINFALSALNTVGLNPLGDRFGKGVEGHQEALQRAETLAGYSTPWRALAGLSDPVTTLRENAAMQASAANAVGTAAGLQNKTIKMENRTADRSLRETDPTKALTAFEPAHSITTAPSKYLYNPDGTVRSSLDILAEENRQAFRKSPIPGVGHAMAGAEASTEALSNLREHSVNRMNWHQWAGKRHQQLRSLEEQAAATGDKNMVRQLQNAQRELAWDQKDRALGTTERVVSDFTGGTPAASMENFISGQARIPGTNSYLPALDPSQWGSQLPSWFRRKTPLEAPTQGYDAPAGF